MKKLGKTLAVIGTILIFLSGAYNGWCLGLTFKYWGTSLVPWTDPIISFLYGLIFLVPGILLLLLGVKQPKKKKEV